MWMNVQNRTPDRGIPHGSVDDSSPETMPFRLAYRRTAGLYPFESQEFLLRVVLGTQPQFSGFRGKSAIFDGVCHQLMKDEADRDRSTRRDADIEVLKMRSDEHTSELQSLMRISYAVFCLNTRKNS